MTRAGGTVRGAPGVAWNGESWFVVWSEQKWAPGMPVVVMGVRLGREDVAPLAEPFQIGTSAQNPRWAPPSVAPGVGASLVAWASVDGIRGARVDADGTLLDASPIVLAGSRYSTTPKTASNGGSWLVTWHELRDGAAPGIFAARVDASGSVLDPSGLTIADRPAPERSPVVARSGPGWMVAWLDQTNGQDVRAARVQEGGGLLDTGGFVVSEHPLSESSLALAEGCGGRHLVAYQRSDPDREPHERVKARIVQVDCVPLASTDATCDGVDDDCSDDADEDYAPVAVACRAESCTSTGTTSCWLGRVVDDCAPVTNEPCPSGGDGGSAGEDSGVNHGAGVGNGGRGGSGGRASGSGGAGGAGRDGSATAGDGNRGGADEPAAGGEAGESDAGEAGQSTQGGATGGTTARRIRSGCSCRTVGAPQSGTGLLLLLALGTVARLRRGRFAPKRLASRAALDSSGEDGRVSPHARRVLRR